MEGQVFLVSLGDARSRRMPKVTRRKGEKVTQEQYKLRLSASVQKPKTKNQSKADRAQQANRHVGSRDADSNLRINRVSRGGMDSPHKLRGSWRMD
ncbi:hypothetical protein AX279_22965 [Pseudomonas sp. J237]|nr:hypothetical protein AX279_22965 [Pseudomonas sp. J237]